MEEHFERLKLVLDRLQNAGLKLNPSKCFLLQKSVSFLGHKVSSDRISAHPDKTRPVAEWPTPTCVRDVRAWLGLTGYYRRFVKDYARISAPLTALLQKNRKFAWTEAAQRAFVELKEALTSPPILAMPAEEGLFTLDTDASDRAISGVLSQCQNGVERVIAYGSKTLSRTQRNYCVTRRELLAIVHFMKYYRHYLLGKRFRVRTDHAALVWLRRTPEPVGQKARWLESMEEFDYFVVHRPGKSHNNADALSRIPMWHGPTGNFVVRDHVVTEEGVDVDNFVDEQEEEDCDAFNYDIRGNVTESDRLSIVVQAADGESNAVGRKEDGSFEEPRPAFAEPFGSPSCHVPLSKVGHTALAAVIVLIMFCCCRMMQVVPSSPPLVPAVMM